MSGWGLRMPPAFPEQAWLRTFGNGRLYNGYAVNSGILAPTGWHVSTDAEWATLVTFCGGAGLAGGVLKSSRTVPPSSLPGFNTPNTGATNSVGFNALGGGIRNSSGNFQSIGVSGFFWTSTQILLNNYARRLDFNNDNVEQAGNARVLGFSVRCILDNPANWSPGMIITDIDGNSYTTVKIGTQVWMGSNLKTTRLNDGTDIPNVTDNSAWAALTTPGQCTYNNAAIAEYIDILQAQTQP